MQIEEFFSHELTEWGKSIEFYIENLETLKERLEEVAAKNTKVSVTAAVEHYQNQLIVQEENLDELKHKVQVQKDKLEDDIKKTAGLSHPEFAETQHFLREYVHLSEKIYMELKHSFYRFLSKVL